MVDTTIKQLPPIITTPTYIDSGTYDFCRALLKKKNTNFYKKENKNE